MYTQNAEREDRKQDVALIAGIPSTCNFFLSLKKEIIKMQGATVEPPPLAPLAGMITTRLPASSLLKAENFKTIKRYHYYFIRANRVGSPKRFLG